MLKRNLATNIIPFPSQVTTIVPKKKRAKTKQYSSFVEYFKGKNVIWIKRKKSSNRAYFMVIELFERSLCAGQDWFINNSTAHNFVWAVDRDANKWNEFPMLID